ncbi:TIGR02611 family protein [Candidatus Saccharibacteria bacterium]|nr:TIGR02611 family protein [Candidatus Saccharibacteria bacterium]
MNNVKRQTRKALVAIVGGLVVLVGIVAIPYPGPGWLIVFAGLAILSTEFEWAQRILHFARGKYDAWQAWLARQKPWIKVTFWCLTAIVVVATIWLLNGYGFINAILGLGWDWLESPLPIPGK